MDVSCLNFAVPSMRLQGWILADPAAQNMTVASFEEKRKELWPGIGCDKPNLYFTQISSCCLNEGPPVSHLCFRFLLHTLNKQSR